MGNCTVCDGTASKKDEFVTNGSVLAIGSQISNRVKGSTKDDHQLEPDEEHKVYHPAPNDHPSLANIKNPSLKLSPREQNLPGSIPILNYRKTFPIFCSNDVIGSLPTNYSSDYESETLIHTGECFCLSELRN